MPRKARIFSPTDYYHIMMRGINKEEIFSNVTHKKLIKELVNDQFIENRVSLIAYCIMNNHLHLVVKGSLTDISTALKKINIRFAMKLNKEQNRVGHVFQDRYKSEIINNDEHLLQVIRYVHNNPVKAKIVNSPKEYIWSSYGCYAKKNEEIIDLDIMDEILEMFGGLSSFIDFHKIEDSLEFIDTRDEMENNRQELAQSILRNYFKENGILELGNRGMYLEHITELVKLLLTKTTLSHRRIASLLEIDNNIVHSINRDVE